jgi:hypothetical protein
MDPILSVLVSLYQTRGLVGSQRRWMSSGLKRSPSFWDGGFKLVGELWESHVSIVAKMS